MDAQILGSKYAEDTGSITYRYTWHLPKDRSWTYDGQLNMVRDEGRWEVRWMRDRVIFLKPASTRPLRCAPTRRRGPRSTSAVAPTACAPGNLYHYELDAKAAGGDLMSTATAVADALRPFDDTMGTCSGWPRRPARRRSRWT